jgi:hypothetical protein
MDHMTHKEKGHTSDPRSDHKMSDLQGSHGSLHLRVSAVGDQTALSGIMQLVAAARASASRAQALADSRPDSRARIFCAHEGARAASRDSATKRIARARLNVALSRARPLRQTRCGSRETHPFFTIRTIKKVVIDDILATEPDARAKDGIAISLGIPGNA